MLSRPDHGCLLGESRPPGIPERHDPAIRQFPRRDEGLVIFPAKERRDRNLHVRPLRGEFVESGEPILDHGRLGRHRIPVSSERWR